MIHRVKLLLFLLVVSIFNVDSQCAMCRAVAESSKEAGSTIANGLNTGILYLMSFPYILLFFAFLTFYFRKKYN
ncbi:MAG: hypothetical protein CMD26_06770 [Flavobacteriales bacterium]|nr:hypothetical protein [Flavobacteriales bacterium]